VSKQILDDRTKTIVNTLHTEQRAREIAHIMGGDVTAISLQSGEEMLARSNQWKENWQRQHAQSAEHTKTAVNS
jgi:DNA repair protein RecN (Recombination protein N)